LLFIIVTGSTKNFAEGLATATGIEAEVLAEKPVRRKRIPPKVAKVHADGEEDDEPDINDIPPDTGL
jgi:hypothetical protein